MLTPAIVNIVSFFYPIGNTPAVCLTQDLPREKQADVLLLGCGDIRTRNVLAFTLLLDDATGSNVRSIWNIYYHLFLDNESLELLQSQSRKLHNLSTSIRSWHDSKYGRFLRVCDEGTLVRIREIWKSYSVDDMNEDTKKSYRQRFKSDIQRAADKKADLLGYGPVMTGFRSAAPVSIQSLEHLPKLYEQFWENGTTYGDSNSLSKAPHPNPMFASLATDTYTLHYGTDPLLGFHLAIAYVPLVSASPLRLETLGNSQEQKIVEAAQLQFEAWAKSFRECAHQGLVLRFFTGDALAFCHTLRQIGKGDGSVSWYRDPFHLEPLVLDSGDHAPTGAAPLSFNVIDTSNLVDHVGALNVLIACSPLLEEDVSATLYTECLVKRRDNLKAMLDDLLCGHFPTVSILLGLFAVEYWTNATATSSVDEGMLDATASIMGNKEDDRGQMHSRMAWKRSIIPSTHVSEATSIHLLHFHEAELAHIFYQVYQMMFRHEDMRVLFSNISLQTLRNHSCPQYHRGSLVSFLALVKERVVVDWDKVMDTFLRLVENDATLLMGKNYIQELYLHLHLFGVHSVPIFRPTFIHSRANQCLGGLSAWKHIPAIVRITLKVPRTKLRVFTSISQAKLGTPPVHCVVQSPRTFARGGWQNIFAVVQSAFGNIKTLGSRDNDDFRVSIEEDPHGWMGSSPLFVSFCAPSWVVLLEPRNASIAFGVQSTPQSTQTFKEPLGLEMNVYETTLGNENAVYITKNRPNQSGDMYLHHSRSANVESHEPSIDTVRISITANVDVQNARIATFTGRVELISERVRSILSEGAKVETVQISPCIIAIIIGHNLRYQLFFPAPVLISRSKSRIARKSSYVEVQAPIAGPMDREAFSHFMYPLMMSDHFPVIWNVPRLSLECLPILDVAKAKDMQWLITHTSLMFSTREHILRKKSMSSDGIHNDVRLDFKDSLFSIFMSFSGLQGDKSRVFALNDTTLGGFGVLLLIVSCLRLDLANHTVVLDAAVLPLTKQLAPRIHTFLAALSGTKFCPINVNDDEARLWRQVIPAMVERCRKWGHHTSCEYLVKSQIPLSLEHGEKFICSCGEGILPTKFISGIYRLRLGQA
ncbi:hypothetical protein OEA41_003389 [Lepraria neglecta]|uniref:DUF4470 domain-containing protein n=1 Tax=Lepraria neglecta TaxID=209136 RepID=A0AAD9Z488_9LECA|nr:hypothetical protein OEA41_003389 [Lepraria neglecta]